MLLLLHIAWLMFSRSDFFLSSRGRTPCLRDIVLLVQAESSPIFFFLGLLY